MMCAAAAAADISGRIAGTVKDPSGDVVPGVAIAVTNNASGAVLRTTTDGQGAFTFPVVPVGAYQLEASHDGFETFGRGPIAVDLGSSLAIEVVLQLATHSEIVQVTESAARVETTTGLSVTPGGPAWPSRAAS